MQEILRAAAIEYKKGMYAPYLLAYGKGELAKKILEIAKEHKIPIKEDEGEVLSLLERLEFPAEIPPEMYVMLLRIFVWLYTEVYDKYNKEK